MLHFDDEGVSCLKTSLVVIGGESGVEISCNGGIAEGIVNSINFVVISFGPNTEVSCRENVSRIEEIGEYDGKLQSVVDFNARKSNNSRVYDLKSDDLGGSDSDE